MKSSSRIGDRKRFVSVLLKTKTYLKLSKQLTAIIRELQNIYADELTQKDLRSFRHLIVRNSGRDTNIPPIATPYNFAINQEWLQRYRHRFLEVRDWGLWGDPAGFGEKEGNGDGDGEGEENGDEDGDGEGDLIPGSASSFSPLGVPSPSADRGTSVISFSA